MIFFHRVDSRSPPVLGVPVVYQNKEKNVADPERPGKLDSLGDLLLLEKDILEWINWHDEEASRLRKLLRLIVHNKLNPNPKPNQGGKP